MFTFDFSIKFFSGLPLGSYSNDGSTTMNASLRRSTVNSPNSKWMAEGPPTILTSTLLNLSLSAF